MMKRIGLIGLCSLTSLIGFGQGFTEIQKISASDRETEDRYGWSVDISGDYAIVGAYADDFGGTNPNMGSAYIYERDADGTWNFAQKIFNSDQDDYDRFSWSLAIDGDKAVIGAYGEDEDENDENTLSKAGSAYIFERGDDGTWTEVQKIVASDRAEADEFGWSVAIHDDLIVVGAHYCSTNATGGGFSLNAGAAYIFEENADGTWTEMQKIVASDRFGNPGEVYEEENWNWRFGESVTVFNDEIVVGSPFAAKTYVYNRSGDTWSETATLTYPGISWLDRAAIVSLHNSTLVVGGQTWDFSEEWGEDELLNAGGAAIYDKNADGDWEFTTMIVGEDRDAGDHFGVDVDLEGDYLVVGCHSDNHDEDDDDFLEDAGSAYIFKRVDDTWSQYAKVDASDRNEGDELGIATAVSGSTALVGAFQQDYPAGGGTYLEDAGAGYFYLDDDDEDCPTVYSSQSPSICDGDSFTVGDSEYTSSGTYSDTFTSVDGCDSIVTTYLTVIGDEPFEYEATICPGQSVTVGESVYTEAGTYTDVFTTDAGCDSIVETTVIMTEGVDGNEIEEGPFGLFTPVFGVTSYQWIKCEPYEELPGETDPFYSPEENGDYAVIVVSEDGCIDTSDCVTWDDGGGTGDDVTIPTTGAGPVQTTCEGTLFDNGGEFFPYDPNSDGEITISPTGATAVELTFETFEVDFEGCDDYLSVYDGASTSDPLIGTYCADSPPPATVSSTGGSITLEFISDATFENFGFEITWECTTAGGTDGIEEEFASEFSIYPNPTTGNFTIDLSNLEEEVTAEVLTELGQVIYRQNLTQNVNLIDLENASPGVYLLRLSSNDKQTFKKIIVQ